jgi:hypothetical protein
MKLRLFSFIQGLAYSILFLLLYLLVLHIFPGPAAVSIINSCPTNATARYTNLVIAPVSYFEMIIITHAYHITGSGVPELLITNLIFVIVGIMAIVLFCNDLSSKYKGKFNANKIILSSVLATWALCLTFIPCGTGISIIGVSLNLFVGICIFKEMLYLSKRRKISRGTLLVYVATAVLTLTIALSYIVSGPAQHLLGLGFFILILAIIEPNFRKIIINLFKPVVEYGR